MKVFLYLYVAGLLLFIPIREALCLSYDSYRDFAGYWILGYSVLGATLMYIGSKNLDRKERWRITLISFLAIGIVSILLFGGIQLIYDSVRNP